MNGDKTVIVKFSLPQTVTVPGDFTTIQAAVEAARSGDIVSVASGVYHGTTIVLNKEIKLASTNPDDPCVVAATIIDSSGYQGGLALLFAAGATANTVVDGFTITSGTYRILDAQNATAAGQNGPDGGSIQGGTVYINTGASPTLKNCVIRDTSITGGNAGSGGNADATNPSGSRRMGWMGKRRRRICRTFRQPDISQLHYNKLLRHRRQRRQRRQFNRCFMVRITRTPIMAVYGVMISASRGSRWSAADGGPLYRRLQVLQRLRRRRLLRRKFRGQFH